MIDSFLASLAPDGDLLLSEISKHITDDMLGEIALADYGQDQERHLAPLLHLRDTGEFINPMHWYPCEVLELTRNNSESGENIGARGHWERAFACAALLRAQEERWNYQGDAGQASFTLVQLMKSIRAVPVDLTTHTVRMIAAKMLNSGLEGTDAEVIYFGVGLLGLALHLNPPPADGDLIELSKWIVRREDELHRTMSWAFDRWLLGIGGDPPPSPWESIGAELAAFHFASHQKELEEWVHLIGSELAGNNSE
jgi:hypothetical protein